MIVFACKLVQPQKFCRTARTAFVISNGNDRSNSLIKKRKKKEKSYFGHFTDKLYKLAGLDNCDNLLMRRSRGGRHEINYQKGD